jgi:hypothetical protein
MKGLGGICKALIRLGGRVLIGRSLMTAIDKVAEAIEKAQVSFGTYPTPYEYVAEKAITALRTPTDEMMRVFEALPQHHNRLDMWCAMIDVALGRIALVEAEDEERN